MARLDLHRASCDCVDVKATPSRGKRPPRDRFLLALPALPPPLRAGVRAGTMDLTLWQYQFRIIMLGDSTVGKSSLLKRYTEGVFLETIDQTVGVDFYVHFLEVEPGVRVKLQFWDTAGQERFRSVTRSYYRNSVGGLLVFDLTSRASFDHVREWHAEVLERVRPHGVLFVLVGHKSDRVSERPGGAGGQGEGERAVSRDEAERLAGQLGAPYVEASSKTGGGVAEAVELLARRVYRALRSGEMELRHGWDGVKCSAPRALELRPAPPGDGAPAADGGKNCAC
ncbi:hypothetical protein AAFF_G00314760 [Aldrovandia affinis]|uniref:Uncharacterized protein n=1 Tax=Aldrovandia affinis TaxID=143900 RepID=A0AAD7R7I9_9TELE|nr:hypothetical protein AAFF_G00314760 [Aldrovandia affinis]